MGKIIKRLLIGFVCLLTVFVLIVGSYLLYVIFQFYRIEDGVALEIEGGRTQVLDVGQAYTATTYNIGFGAYDQAYSFFMDTGEMLDGTKVAGKYGKAVSKQNAQKNTDGAIAAIGELDSDFVLVQEADKKADRSFGINQVRQLMGVDGYSAIYASNFHSAYLFYPFGDPIGASESGLVVMSKLRIDSAVRRSFPVDMSFPARFFDLDRAFVVCHLPVEGGKTLTLINLHMSAYDEGGKIRAKQLAMLNAVLAEEYAKGNYVIAGGDFNHDIADTADRFETQQKLPIWVSILTDNDLADGFRLVGDPTAPSCRSADMPYQKGVNYTVSIDGFIVSDNVDINWVKTLNHEFLYSDHQPVTIEFVLT